MNDQIELIKKARRILINLATNRKTITYSDLARKLELPDCGNSIGRTLSPILEKITQWCENRAMPPLSAIVVHKSGVNKGYPGRGFWNAINANNSSPEEFLNKNWFESIKKTVFDYWDIETTNFKKSMSCIEKKGQ